MKECLKCGKEIEENSLYCPHCGTKQVKKEDGFFKRLFKYTKNYVMEEPKKENSLLRFMASSMNIAFILLIIYSVLCGLYDFLGLLGLFVFLKFGNFVELLVSIPSLLGDILVIVVSLRGIKEITKLGNQALEDEKSKEILIRIFSGGIVFIILIFLVLLN